MDDLSELRAMCDALRTECVKFFEEGNKTAGTRARKMLQQIKGKAQELRVAIQETKRAMEVARTDGPDGGMGLDGPLDVGAAPAEGATAANDPTKLEDHDDVFDGTLLAPN